MPSTPRPCSSLDTHRWNQGITTFLSLADTIGWCDVFRSWHCTRCGAAVWATGAVDRDTPPLSPVDWQAQATAQQAGGDLYGVVAQQQEAWERQQRGVHKRLKGGRR
jgi:hypothetical protein